MTDQAVCRLVSKTWKKSVDLSILEVEKLTSTELLERGQTSWIKTIQLPLGKQECELLKKNWMAVRGGFFGKRRICLQLQGTGTSLIKDVAVATESEVDDMLAATKNFWETVNYLELTDSGISSDYDIIDLRRCSGFEKKIAHVMLHMVNVKIIVLRSSYCGIALNCLPNKRNLEEIVQRTSTVYTGYHYEPVWSQLFPSCHLNLKILHVEETTFQLWDGLLEYVFPQLVEFHEEVIYPSHIVLDRVMPNLTSLGVNCSQLVDWICLMKLCNKLKFLQHVKVDTGASNRLTAILNQLVAPANYSIRTVFVRVAFSPSSTSRLHNDKRGHMIAKFFPSADIEIVKAGIDIHEHMTEDEEYEMDNDMSRP